MTDYKRYALYHAPETGAFADTLSRWLGWDSAAAAPRDHPDVPGLPRPVAEITARPRKYGVHATLKPPFRLAEGSTPEALAAEVEALAAERAPVRLPGLRLARIGPFLALVPDGETAALDALAGACVRDLDRHRALLTDEELARRRAGRLSDRQEALLAEFGYPYVMEEFRFHITLTGPLPPEELAATEAALGAWFAPLLPAPYRIASLCLFGEAPDGMFHLVHRYALTG
ncbi:DUF1045 domain-containing protein [Roseivivax sediminis]|uniref:Putative phosphonate metabolism protein n=1 Tax=Roseivivax sediminis TaxID=936889 RepID=A0A1I2A0I0_9RHOB|nr:DUF1045 domain-containing protein [Roseivivax sediminis]SFE37465.1 putative phosphonate metabolism protein [Roseivivax sediminis]